MTDIEALLDSLPRRELVRPALIVEPVPLRRATWPLNRPYNGFSPTERRRAWQLGWYLSDLGALPHARSCSICGARSRVQSHSENYYSPVAALEVCRACHRALHQRFRQPELWRALVAHHGRDGTEWFEVLTTTRLDVAAYLRERHGAEVADLLYSPLFPWPEWLPRPTEPLLGMDKHG